MNQKIAIIDPVGNKAGSHYYDISLLESLSKLGAKPYLFTNYTEAEDKVKIYFLFNTAISIKIIKLFNFLFGYLKAFKICKKEGIKKVIINVWSTSLKDLLPFLIAKIYNIKIISIAHDISDFANEDIGFVKNLIFNKLSEDIVVHNKFSFTEISDKLSSETLKKIHIIKHGGFINLINSEITPENALKRLELSNDTQYILFFGQIKKVKGLDILLKALPKIDDNIKLIIAGKPWKDDFAYYQQIIDDLELNERVIKFIHYISDDMRENLFRAANAIIIPYKRIYMSGVLLMAMSYGLPVIASDLIPFKEIIKDGHNGMLFISQNIISLANKVNELLINDGLNKKIIANAIRTIREDYSWDDIAKEYKILLENTD